MCRLFAGLQSSCYCVQSPVPHKSHDLLAIILGHVAHLLYLQRLAACHSMLLLLLQCTCYSYNSVTLVLQLHVLYMYTVQYMYRPVQNVRQCHQLSCVAEQHLVCKLTDSWLHLRCMLCAAG